MAFYKGLGGNYNECLSIPCSLKGIGKCLRINSGVLLLFFQCDEFRICVQRYKFSDFSLISDFVTAAPVRVRF